MKQAISSSSKSRIAAAGTRQQIAEALALVDEALSNSPGPFALEAAIAAEHCKAARADDTDWPRIVRLYDLVATTPALARRRVESRGRDCDGPGTTRGLAIIDELAAGGELDEYHLLYAARADMLRRLGSNTEAAESYELALNLATNDSERRFLERRLREVRSPAS